MVWAARALNECDEQLVARQARVPVSLPRQSERLQKGERKDRQAKGLNQKKTSGNYIPDSQAVLRTCPGNSLAPNEAHQLPARLHDRHLVPHKASTGAVCTLNTPASYQKWAF
ncbi:hypothetical protein C7W93_15500 [Glaciimonas sp. PCH181]|nr:hypothetical protein C7W93_15500 [Glaciimonas sp. PCH181]